MTTLVTGAFGCIGAWVVRGLLAAGERPVVYDLGDDPWRIRMIAGADAPDRIVMVRGDITDRERLARAVREHAIRRVIHLAAWQVPLCRQDPPRGAAINVVGTANVFDVVRAAAGQIERVVRGGLRRARALSARPAPGRCACAPGDALRRLQGRQRGDGARLLGGASYPVVGLPSADGLRAGARLRAHRGSDAGHEGRRPGLAVSDPLGRRD